VDPESVDSIAGGIRRVLDDAGLRAQLVAAGRERSRGFRWRRCASETLRVLEQVVPDPQRAPVLAPGRSR
jgi:glycosyltransferase involved in cell wall biosynthesis